MIIIGYKGKWFSDVGVWVWVGIEKLFGIWVFFGLYVKVVKEW